MRRRRHDPVIGREALKRVRRRGRQEHRREVRRIESGRARREAVLLEESEVEPDVVANEDAGAGEGRESRDRVLGRGRADEILVPDPGEPGDRRTDVAPRIDERREPLPRLCAVGGETNAHRADLDDPIRLRIESRRLQVDRDELLHEVADLGRPHPRWAARVYG